MNGFDIRAGWMNAAGILGFAPTDVPAHWPAPVAFVTNPVSTHRRIPAEARSVQRFDGGVLVHTGWPNPGLRRVLQAYALRWARSPWPVWVHLLADEASELQGMVRRLEEVEGVQALEISLSPAAEANAAAVLAAAQGELPVLLRIGVDQVREGWLPSALQTGVSGLVLGAPRGRLINLKGELAQGRLYGPALTPIALQALENAQRWKLPVICGAGMLAPEQGDAALKLGAAAIQIDIALWQQAMSPVKK